MQKMSFFLNTESVLMKLNYSKQLIKSIFKFTRITWTNEYNGTIHIHLQIICNTFKYYICTQNNEAVHKS